MELYRLRSFMAIMRAGNLTRAAEQLNLSQSALSSQLKQLEEELGLQLFRRTARGMELSESGRELLPVVEEIFEAVDKLDQRARTLSQGEGETLHLGLNADPGFLKVGAINRRLTQLHENLNIVFLSSQTARTPHLLRQGQLDLAYVYGQIDEPDIHSHYLADVRFCVVIPDGLAQPDQELGWSEVADLPWVWVEHNSPPYEALLQEFSRQRLSPRQVVKTVDEFIVKELVVDGQGLAIMREDEARSLVEAGAVSIWNRGWISIPLSLSWLVRNEERSRISAARDAVHYVWQARHEKQDGLDRFIY